MLPNASVRGVSRVLEKLENSLREKNYYEAHQMYRTLYFRYLGQKKYEELLDLLYKGALILLEKDQKLSGADLSILLVDVMTKSKTAPCDSWFSKIIVLFTLIGPYVPERETFLSNSLTWSKIGDNKLGHPELHKKLAQAYWQEKNYGQARYHYMFSMDGSGFASMLVELHTEKGLNGEIDLFITQAVLQYLCRNNPSTAQETFIVYTEKHPSIRKIGPPYIFPLLNFLWFLLKAIQGEKQLTTFTILCEQYKPSLKRDPMYMQYLDKIGQLFFGVPAPKNQNNGLFGDLMQSFLNSLDTNNDSSDEDQRSGTGAKHKIESAELD